MAVTARAFSDALKSALIVDEPLWLTLNDGRQHRVLLPVSILEGEVAFAGPYISDQRIVVTWKEIASLQVGGQGAAPHDRVISANDRLTMLLLTNEVPAVSADHPIGGSARGRPVLQRATRHG
jgi:hypothetical protein